MDISRPDGRIGNVNPNIDVPGDRVERPSLAEIYDRTFASSCAQAALDAYKAALKSNPAHPYAAVIVGHEAGKRCQHKTFRQMTEFLKQRPAGPTLKLPT